ncbi:hypothetical protein B0H10DRAFT_1954486 [Mycena sp. CBHHK59/15]|nr:hypothetical protein B0H10DRAFT_1954486 [Mycena sp. CBHHK59/15]
MPPLDQFIINSHAFHNAHVLHAALPRDLFAPIPLFEDRKAKHNEFTATLCENWALRTAKHKAAAAGTNKKKTAPHKRKTRAKPDSNSDKDAQAIGPSNKRCRTTAPRVDLPAETLLDGRGSSIVASKIKRTIKQIEQAMAVDNNSDDGEDDNESGGEHNDMYNISEDNDSD